MRVQITQGGAGTGPQTAVGTTTGAASSTFSSTLSIPFEQPVTSLSISPLGKEAVLAAKRGLYIINLENPFESPKILHHLSKWDVADCAWNPHQSRQEWIVTTSNTKALIWNVHRESSHVQFVLNKHLRAISDIHWSPFLPEMVATCSYDAYVHLWDLRLNPEKPANSFCGWNAGATQVKFNRVNEYLLASSHDTDVRIWDTRKGSSPITLITAHRTKIYGLDWSRSVEDELLTCSQDTLVKIWNIKTPRTCRATIETSSPCWRARYTPFGNGILTMPQRKDNNLYLWNLDRPEAPAYTFAGHVDTPTEFVWRYQANDGAIGPDFAQEYQLVTWSKDMHLRLWPIGKEIAASAGVDVRLEEETPRTTDFPTSSPRNIKPRRNYSDSHLHGSGLSSGSSDPDNSFGDSASNGSNKSSALSRSRDSASDEESVIIDNDLVDIEMELNNVQAAFPSVYIDRSNLGSRRCTIRLERIDPAAASSSNSKQSNKPILFQVNISFPKGYPKLPLYCDIQRNWSISMMNRNFLSRKLGLISASFAKRNKACLEFIVKYLLGGNNSTDSTEALNNKSSSPLSLPLAHKSELGTAAATVGDDSDSDSSGLDDILLPPKAFTADRAPAGLVDESDDSFSDESNAGGGGGAIGIGIGGMAMGRHLDSTAHEKGSNSVPFPRLCSATFSPTGQLIYFFSPLPHPSNSKFTAYTLTTRNQQPILQSQNFSAQPKTYQLYESYRNFVLSKVPKNRFLGGVSANITDLIPAKDGTLRDRKLDYWLDDEDMDDDSLSLYWRPKPTTTMQPQSMHTADFLARLVSFRSTPAASTSTAAKITLSESPGLGSGNLKDHPMHTTLSAFAGPLLQNHGGVSSVSMSDISTVGVAIKYPGLHTRRKSSSIVPDPASTSWTDLGMPARHFKGSLEGVGFRHKKGRSEGAGDFASRSPGLEIGPISVTPPVLSEAENNSYGTIVFSASVEFLCGPDVRAAKEYVFGGGEEGCRYNMNVAYTRARPDLVQFWRVAEMVCHEGGTALLGVLEDMVCVLGDRKDVQTLSTLLCVCGDVGLGREEERERHSFMPSFLTTSPAMGAGNAYLQVIPGPVGPGRLSRLCKSMKVPFSGGGRDIYTHSVEESQSRHYRFGKMVGGRGEEEGEFVKRMGDMMKRYRSQIYLYSTYLYDCGLFDKRIQLLKSAIRFDPGASEYFSGGGASGGGGGEGKSTGFQVVPGGGALAPSVIGGVFSVGGGTVPSRSVVCLYCRCRTRGLLSFCIYCKHGGHTSCMRKVYLDRDRASASGGGGGDETRTLLVDPSQDQAIECLSGCGCSCSFAL